MYKYRHFPIFFGLAGILLLVVFFPVSFDNNDDQYMYFISSGALSGSMSPALLLTNVVIGKLLNLLYSFSYGINWYTVYLQAAQAFAFAMIFIVFAVRRGSLFGEAWMIITAILIGFAALCVVKVQFTAAALLCALTGLLVMQSDLSRRMKMICTLLLVFISILIRKETFYVLLLFSLPVLLNKFSRENFKSLLVVIIVTVIFFLATDCINKNYSAYKKAETYAYLHAFDIIAAQPISYNKTILQEHNFSEDDIVLLRSWFAADEHYQKKNSIISLAEDLKASRTYEEVISQLKKFTRDERYALLMLAFSFLIVLIFAKKKLAVSVSNLIIAAALILYLAITSRIPHRLTFPILTYITLANLYYFLQASKSKKKRYVLLLFLMMGAYKFYCVCGLYKINSLNHQHYEEIQNEISTHPDDLFIALYDGYPVQFMNAWKPPIEFSRSKNLILTCWYAYSSDFKTLLENHQLKDLTSGLKGKTNVLFLTHSEEFENSYINVMKQRYQMDCHFETPKQQFRYLPARLLVFDN